MLLPVKKHLVGWESNRFVRLICDTSQRRSEYPFEIIISFKTTKVQAISTVEAVILKAIAFSFSYVEECYPVKYFKVSILVTVRTA